MKFSVNSCNLPTNSAAFSMQSYHLGIMITLFLLFKPIAFYFFFFFGHIVKGITSGILQDKSGVISRGHEIGWRDRRSHMGDWREEMRVYILLHTCIKFSEVKKNIRFIIVMVPISCFSC